MNSIDQYIQLYREHREAIDAHAPALINRLRPAALSALTDAALPRKGDEGYPEVSLNDLFAPDFGVNINRVAFPTDVAASFHCDVPNVSTLLGVVAGDSFVATSSLRRNLPEGVTVCSLAQACTSHPDVVERWLAKVAPDCACASTALNTLLLQDGVFVHVDRGVHLDKPVQIVNILNATAPMMAVRRMLIVLEADSSARMLVCDHSQNPDTDYLSNQVIEVVAGRGARLDYIDIEESSRRTARVSRMHVRQEQGSRVNINGTTLIGGTTRNDYIIDLEGERTETVLTGMLAGDGNQLTDNCSRVNHTHQHCHSRQLFKYVLDGESRGCFEGGITVSEGADFTEAYQTNHNLLASASAMVHTMPQLEIYCDEVKCSHGATSGQLDDKALFYMRSRGIPLDEARMMLMQAFMADVIDTIAIDGIRDRMRHLVEKRLTGRMVLCGECDADCIKHTLID